MTPPTMTSRANNDINLAGSDEEVAACFPLMAQLRPHLSGEEEFVARWRRQVDEGYRLAVLKRDGIIAALAGFRLQENLIYGRFLYVDDLVTDEKLRSTGLGERMMRYLETIAREEGCDRLVLDTPLANVLGHRFYYRQGLLARALRFNLSLV